MLQDVCDRWNMPEVTAEEVYTDIFRLGEGYIQKAGETRNMKGNPLVYMKSHNRQKGEYRILLEDTIMDTLKEAQEADFSIVNGLTYFGRKNIQAAAHQMYAMIFDLDGVTEDTLMDFFSGAIRADTYPTPNYISLSGHGVHLYYLFEEPVSLYPNMKVLLKEIKYALIRLMWNPYTSTEERRQYQGINQSFRLIGGKTKIPGVRVRAFKVIDQKYTVKDLYDRVADAVGLDFDKKLIEREKKLTLEEAAEKYPEWYQRRIIEGDTSKGRWTDKRDLYDWWKRQIATGATHGHRYFCVMALCIYGVKCDISQEEVEADAYGLIPFMNEVHAADPFT